MVSSSKINLNIASIRNELSSDGLRLAPGETKILEATENLTTGYSWYLIGDPIVGFTIEHEHRKPETLPG